MPTLSSTDETAAQASFGRTRVDVSRRVTTVTTGHPMSFCILAGMQSVRDRSELTFHTTITLHKSLLANPKSLSNTNLTTKLAHALLTHGWLCAHMCICVCLSPNSPGLLSLSHAVHAHRRLCAGHDTDRVFSRGRSQTRSRGHSRHLDPAELLDPTRNGGLTVLLKGHELSPPQVHTVGLSSFRPIQGFRPCLQSRTLKWQPDPQSWKCPPPRSR